MWAILEKISDYLGKNLNFVLLIGATCIILLTLAFVFS